MGERHAQTFESLRGAVLERLVEVRSSIDHAFAAVPDDVIRDQFDQILARMQGFLADGEVERYRGFLHRWTAIRVGEGYSAENLVHSIVALGDVVIQTAKLRLPPDQETMLFCREVVRMSGLAARLIVDNLADELRRRLDQKRVLGGGRSWE